MYCLLVEAFYTVMGIIIELIQGACPYRLLLCNECKSYISNVLHAVINNLRSLTNLAAQTLFSEKSQGLANTTVEVCLSHLRLFCRVLPRYLSWFTAGSRVSCNT